MKKTQTRINFAKKMLIFNKLKYPCQPNFECHEPPLPLRVNECSRIGQLLLIIC